MPLAARGNHVDSVLSDTGSGANCENPLVTSTNACSNKVFAEGTGIVRQGDVVTAHPKTGCGSEAPGLSSYSSKVFIQGRGAGRVGDVYGPNTITSGSSKVTLG